MVPGRLDVVKGPACKGTMLTFGAEGIPAPRREALYRAFVRRIRQNDKHTIRWPWPRRGAAVDDEQALRSRSGPTQE